MESSFVIYLIKNKKTDRTVKTDQWKADQQKQNSEKQISKSRIVKSRSAKAEQ